MFLQPNMAREEKKEFFAASRPVPNGPAPPKPKDDNSYYLDAPSTPMKPAPNFNADDYFSTPKK